MKHMLLIAVLCLAGACVDAPAPTVAEADGSLAVVGGCFKSSDGITTCCLVIQRGDRGIAFCLSSDNGGPVKATVHVNNEPTPSDGWTKIEVPKHGLVDAECWNEEQVCWFPSPDGPCVHDVADGTVVCLSRDGDSLADDEPRNCGPGTCGRLGCYCHPDPLAGAVAQ